MAERALRDAYATSSRRLPAVAAIVAMSCGVLALYFPPSLWEGNTTLQGMDFWVLHLRRIEFAREYWLSGSLPGWYPRELLGTPFWSNLQNFPWIPTRLLILAIDPVFSYTVGVNLAALLAAGFTYLYGRIIGWSPAASALAGWTFACAGFYAARVTVGHLPLLEAYPTLPMLLWLAERSLRNGNRSRDLFALAVGTACTVVAGHPQLPAYAVATTLAYLGWMSRAPRTSTDARPAHHRWLRPMAAMAFGASATLVVWWPMLKLLGRSTRTLALSAARNDLVFPYARLRSLVAPWIDGWPSAVHRNSAEPFVGFPSTGYFWDTFAYVGVAPWLVVVASLLLWLRRRATHRSSPTMGHRTLFVSLLGTGSLLLALPIVESLGDWIPGTYLRSPARLLYLTTFSLCIAMGAGVQALLGSSWPRSSTMRVVLVCVVVAAHGVDLFVHDRPFVYARSRTRTSMTEALPIIEQQLGTARIAVDHNLLLDFNRRFDDVGFFDSIILARPYRALLALAGRSPDTNVQNLSGSGLSAEALANLGVRFVVTGQRRDDLPFYGREKYSVYVVPNPVARVAFFDEQQVVFVAESTMLERLTADGFDLGAGLMLPNDALRGPHPATPAHGAEGSGVEAIEASIRYARPAPDRIALRTITPRAGFVRIVESWDPGWSASIDGQPVPVLRADTFAMAVAVEPGEHEIEWRYATPGLATGVMGSLLSIVGLIGLLWWNASSPPRE
jgi:hypothetical protein